MGLAKERTNDGYLPGASKESDMTSTDWGLLISGLVPFLIALTAWLRAEVANKTANSANVTATAANVRSKSVADAVGSTPPGDGK